MIAAGGALGAAALAGCMGTSEERTERAIVDPEDYVYDREHPDDEAAARESTLTYVQELERGENFDLVVTNDAYSVQVAGLIYDELFTYTSNLEYEPKVAVDFPDVEREDTRYLYEIHEGIEFHNGEELTANDVVYTLLAVAQEEGPNQGQYTVVEDATVIDDYQLQVDLAHPYGPWELAMQGIPVMPESARSADPEAFNRDPVGSGPFVWSDFAFNEFVELERNDAYWDEPTPYVKRIRFEDATDSANRVAQIRAGDADAIGSVPNNDWETLDNDEDIRLHIRESPRVEYINFNCREGAGTADPNVRRGIAHAFSMTDYVETHLNNTAGVLRTPTAPITNELWDFPLEEWAQLYPEYDPDRAKALLDDHAPADWSPTILAPNDERAALAERIANRLDEIGYEMSVRTMGFGTLLENTIYSDGDPEKYELYIMGWTGGPDPDHYLYDNIHESQAGVNQGVFYEGSEGFHDTIIAARESVDRDEREGYYIELIEEMLEELPLLPAYSNHTTIATRKRVKDFHAHPNVHGNPNLVSSEGNVWVDD